MKPVLAVLGVGMIILGLVGISSVAWLGWLDVAIGAIALLESGLLGRATRGMTIASQAGLGIAAIALWIIALATGTVAWLAWWTFGFGVAFLVLSAVPAPQLTGGPRNTTRGPLP